MIVLTFNEQENLGQCLKSVCGWASEVFVVDSYSSDQTRSIALQYGCDFVQHKFEDYSKQRNWALDSLHIQSEWILFVDADEWLPDNLKYEIASTIQSFPMENGFLIKRRFLWMGKWIRYGYYPTWLLRLFRKGRARCEERGINEHIIADGAVGRLKYDLMHEDRKGITAWTCKHLDYSKREAELMLVSGPNGQLPERLFGTPAERIRWLRVRVYNQLPPLVRPLLLFVYRMILRGGLLDGPKAWIYHFLHALWVPLLIDCIYLETRRELSRKQT